jgi:hypothetical protein
MSPHTRSTWERRCPSFGYFLSCEEHSPAELVEQARMATAVPCGDDPDAHVEALSAFVDAGFDTVYVNQIGKDQQSFFDFYRTKILPRLRE